MMAHFEDSFTKEQLWQNRVQDNKSLNIDIVEEAAKLLKESLGLTIFGFDVVVSVSFVWSSYGLVLLECSTATKRVTSSLWKSGTLPVAIMSSCSTFYFGIVKNSIVIAGSRG